MLHLLMRFEEDTPVFTGMAFAKGSMASGVADYRNKNRQGFHFVTDMPVDSSEDYDGSDDIPEGVNEVVLVMVNDGKEEVVHSVHSDEHAASLIVLAKKALKPESQFRTTAVKVHHGYPPDMGDAGTMAVL